MADLSLLTSNYFATPKEGFTTTLASTISSGAATVPLNSVSGYTNGAIATFAVDPTDPTKKQVFTGVVDTSGVQLTSVKWTEGTNQSHTTGATVVDYVTATHFAALVKGLTTTVLTQAGVLATNAITSASQITDGIVGDAEMATAVKPVTLFNENFFDHVVSGCVWTADAAGSTRLASMTSGVAVIAGKRVTVAAVTGRTFTASKDVYVGLIDAGDGTATVVYYDNTTNAASPSLATAAYTMVIAIVVVGASSIANAAAINQGQEDRVLPIASSTPYAVTDSLGNLVCPRDPSRKILGYRQITSGASQAALALVTGLTMPIIVPTGRKVKITVVIGPSLNLDTDASNARISIWDGTVSSGTQLQENGFSTAAANQGVSVSVMAVSTLSAGLHTINIGGRVAGGGTQTVNAAATTPTFVMAELV